MFDYVYSLVEKEKPAVMVISSTVEISAGTEGNLRSKCGELIIIDRNHTGIFNEYDVPAYLSPDRLASVIAARYLFKEKGSVVFDFGTTLTIDVIEADGRYSGGNVSPGFRTRFKSLARYSRTLPIVGHALVMAHVKAAVVAEYAGTYIVLFVVDDFCEPCRIRKEASGKACAVELTLCNSL